MNKPELLPIPGRRRFLRACAATVTAIGTSRLLSGCAPTPESVTRLEVAEGFRPRIVARTRYVSSPGAGYHWHPAPDGGGCFDAGDGGWIYLSNSENSDEGGVGALRFDAGGQVVDSYPVLAGSRHNCDGGVTPWGTWLSCEEVDRGLVWECDPFGIEPAVSLPALGLCKHESAAVDPETGQIYLTEDETDGRLYRFTPGSWVPGLRPDLSMGNLEVARETDGRIDWLPVPDPSGQSAPLRDQVDGSAVFRGGEGISLSGRMLRFSTKRDNRIWQLNLLDDSLVVFDQLPGAPKRVDNVEHSPSGEVLISEDGQGMQILYYPANDKPPVTLLRVPDHHDSEITGLAFDPGGTRLYFSSQRGSTGSIHDGLTFELEGDFAGLTRDLKLTTWNLDHATLS